MSFIDADDVDRAIRMRRADAIAVVALVRLLGCHEILPLAFYICCSLGEVLVTGVTYGAEVVRLEPNDLKTCLAGREILVKENTDVMKAFIEGLQTDARPKDCTQPHLCSRASKRLALLAMEDGLFSDPKPCDEVDVWLDESYGAHPESKPCHRCNAALRSAIRERQENVWQKLGKIFGVEPWPVQT